MNKKIIGGISASAIAGVLVLTGCSHSQNAQQIAQNQQQQDALRLENNQPIPQYDYSQERQTLIEAQNMAAKGTPTTTFFFAGYNQNPYFSCPSIGIGIPDTSSLSNPDQIAPVSGKYGGGTQVVGQMDAYGIYSPQTSNGTFVICVKPDGQEFLVRDEGVTTTFSAGAKWDTQTHQVVVGNPTAHIDTNHNGK